MDFDNSTYSPKNAVRQRCNAFTLPSSNPFGGTYQLFTWDVGYYLRQAVVAQSNYTLNHPLVNTEQLAIVAGYQYMLEFYFSLECNGELKGMFFVNDVIGSEAVSTTRIAAGGTYETANYWDGNQPRGYLELPVNGFDATNGYYDDWKVSFVLGTGQPALSTTFPPLGNYSKTNLGGFTPPTQALVTETTDVWRMCEWVHPRYIDSSSQRIATNAGSLINWRRFVTRDAPRWNSLYFHGSGYNGAGTLQPCADFPSLGYVPESKIVAGSSSLDCFERAAHTDRGGTSWDKWYEQPDIETKIPWSFGSNVTWSVSLNTQPFMQASSTTGTDFVALTGTPWEATYPYLISHMA